MIVEFGTGRTRPIHENGCRFDLSAVLDGRGELYAKLLKISIDFRLIGTSPTALDSQITGLETFYAGTQDSFRLLHDNGTTPTAHSWAAGTTFGGFRVSKPPSYLRFQNAEYVAYRTGQIELEALIKLFDDNSRILEFSETLEYEGGGEIYGHLIPNEGLATKQRTREKALWLGTQSGRITHQGEYGAIPRPIFPGALIAKPKLRAESARRIGSSLVGYPTSYSYSFESATPLAGTPTQWTDLE